MKKFLNILLIFSLLLSCVPALAQQDTPPEMPPAGMGEPPEGTPPDGFGGGQGGPGGPGGHGGPGGMPGGHSSFSGEYDAVTTLDTDTEISGEFISTDSDQNAILVTGGNVSLTNGTVVRSSTDSTGGDNASFYGVGAAVLATGGTLTIDNVNISTDAVQYNLLDLDESVVEEMRGELEYMGFKLDSFVENSNIRKLVGNAG